MSHLTEMRQALDAWLDRDALFSAPEGGEGRAACQSPMVTDKSSQNDYERKVSRYQALSGREFVCSERDSGVSAFVTPQSAFLPVRAHRASSSPGALNSRRSVRGPHRCVTRDAVHREGRRGRGCASTRGDAGVA